MVTQFGMGEDSGYVNYAENSYGIKSYSDSTNEVKHVINIDD